MDALRRETARRCVIKQSWSSVVLPTSFQGSPLRRQMLVFCGYSLITVGNTLVLGGGGLSCPRRLCSSWNPKWRDQLGSQALLGGITMSTMVKRESEAE